MQPAGGGPPAPPGRQEGPVEQQASQAAQQRQELAAPAAAARSQAPQQQRSGAQQQQQQQRYAQQLQHQHHHQQQLQLQQQQQHHHHRAAAPLLSGLALPPQRGAAPGLGMPLAQWVPAGGLPVYPVVPLMVQQQAMLLASASAQTPMPSSAPQQLMPQLLLLQQHHHHHHQQQQHQAHAAAHQHPQQQLQAQLQLQHLQAQQQLLYRRQLQSQLAARPQLLTQQQQQQHRMAALHGAPHMLLANGLGPPVLALPGAALFAAPCGAAGAAGFAGGGRAGAAAGGKAGSAQQHQQQQQRRRQRRPAPGGGGSDSSDGADGASVCSLCRSSCSGDSLSPRGAGSSSCCSGSSSGTSSAAAAVATAAAAAQPPAPPADAGQNMSWAWLVDGILQQVVQGLAGHSSLQAFRRTCRHWKAVADQNICQLAPRCLKPKDLIALFPRLAVLELVACPNVRNRDLYVLAQSPIRLRCLTLGDDTNKPWVTNRGLSSIGRMGSLESLALHECNSITNNGMAALSGLRRLSSLSLRGCRKITNNGLEVLQASSSLTSLNLHGCKRISDKGLNAVSRLPLRALSLGLTRVKDEGLCHLARGLPGLTELHLTQEEVGDAGLLHLSACTELGTLAMRSCSGVTANALQALLVSLPRLTHLTLFGNAQFGDEHLAGCCAHMMGVASLDLRETAVTAFGLVECTQLSALRQLWLKPLASLGEASVLTVSRLTQLSRLALCLPGYSEALMDSLRRLGGLRELDLSSGNYDADLTLAEPVPHHVLAALTSMTQLRSLDLSRRLLSDRQLHELCKRLPLLSALTIHGVPITPEQLSRLERRHPAVSIRKRSGAADTPPELAALFGSLSIT